MFCVRCTVSVAILLLSLSNVLYPFIYFVTEFVFCQIGYVLRDEVADCVYDIALYIKQPSAYYTGYVLHL